MTSLLSLPRPEALAKIGARCRLCCRRIVVGEHYVSKLPRIGWVHAECANGYCQLMAENSEDNS